MGKVDSPKFRTFRFSLLLTLKNARRSNLVKITIVPYPVLDELFERCVTL